MITGQSDVLLVRVSRLNIDSPILHACLVHMSVHPSVMHYNNYSESLYLPDRRVWVAISLYPQAVTVYSAFSLIVAVH